MARGYLQPSAGNPNRISPIDAATWMRLHNAKTAVKGYKELPTRALSPRAVSPRHLVAPPQGYQQTGPLSPRLISRPPSARNSPRIAVRPSPWSCVVKTDLEVFKQAVRDWSGPLSEDRVTKLKEEQERRWGELPDGVSGDDLRKAANQIKEKLLSKYGILTKAFRAIDEDGSGTITRDELDRYIGSLHLTLRKNVVDALFETIDADASGSFDFKEFTRAMSAGDIMKMEAVKTKYDGYEAKRLPRKLIVIH